MKLDRTIAMNMIDLPTSDVKCAYMLLRTQICVSLKKCVGSTIAHGCRITEFYHPPCTD